MTQRQLTKCYPPYKEPFAWQDEAKAQLIRGMSDEINSKRIGSIYPSWIRQQQQQQQQPSFPATQEKLSKHGLNPINFGKCTDLSTLASFKVAENNRTGRTTVRANSLTRKVIPNANFNWDNLKKYSEAVPYKKPTCVSTVSSLMQQQQQPSTLIQQPVSKPAFVTATSVNTPSKFIQMANTVLPCNKDSLNQENKCIINSSEIGNDGVKSGKRSCEESLFKATSSRPRKSICKPPTVPPEAPPSSTLPHATPSLAETEESESKSRSKTTAKKKSYVDSSDTKAKPKKQALKVKKKKIDESEPEAIMKTQKQTKEIKKTKTVVESNIKLDNNTLVSNVKKQSSNTSNSQSSSHIEECKLSSKLASSTNEKYFVKSSQVKNICNNFKPSERSKSDSSCEMQSDLMKTTTNHFSNGFNNKKPLENSAVLNNKKDVILNYASTAATVENKGKKAISINLADDQEKQISHRFLGNHLTPRETIKKNVISMSSVLPRAPDVSGGHSSNKSITSNEKHTSDNENINKKSMQTVYFRTTPTVVRCEKKITPATTGNLKVNVSNTSNIVSRSFSENINYVLVDESEKAINSSTTKPKNALLNEVKIKNINDSTSAAYKIYLSESEPPKNALSPLKTHEDIFYTNNKLNIISIQTMENASRYFLKNRGNHKTTGAGSRLSEKLIKPPEEFNRKKFGTNTENIVNVPRCFSREELVVLSIDNPLTKLKGKKLTTDLMNFSRSGNIKKTETLLRNCNEDNATTTKEQQHSITQLLDHALHDKKEMNSITSSHKDLEFEKEQFEKPNLSIEHSAEIGIGRSPSIEQAKVNQVKLDELISAVAAIENEVVRPTNHSHQQNPFYLSSDVENNFENIKDDNYFKQCSNVSASEDNLPKLATEGVILNRKSPVPTSYEQLGLHRSSPSLNGLSSVVSVPRTPEIKPTTKSLNNVLGRFSPVPQRRRFGEQSSSVTEPHIENRFNSTTDIGKYNLLSHESLKHSYNITNVNNEAKNLFLKRGKEAIMFDNGSSLMNSKHRLLSQASTEDSLQYSDYFLAQMLKQGEACNNDEFLQLNSRKNCFINKGSTVNVQPETYARKGSSTSVEGLQMPSNISFIRPDTTDFKLTKVLSNDGIKKRDHQSYSLEENSYQNENNDVQGVSCKGLSSYESSSYRNKATNEHRTSNDNVLLPSPSKCGTKTTDNELRNSMNYLKMSSIQRGGDTDFVRGFKTAETLLQPFICFSDATKGTLINKDKFHMSNEQKKLEAVKKSFGSTDTDENLLNVEVPLPKLHRHQFEALLNKYLCMESPEFILDNTTLTDFVVNSVQKYSLEISSNKSLNNDLSYSEKTSNETKKLLQKFIGSVASRYELREDARSISKTILFQKFVCNILLKKHAHDLLNYYKNLLNEVFDLTFSSLDEVPTLNSVSYQNPDDDLHSLNPSFLKRLRSVIHEVTRTDESFLKELRRLLTRLESNYT